MAAAIRSVQTVTNITYRPFSRASCQRISILLLILTHWQLLCLSSSYAPRLRKRTHLQNASSLRLDGCVSNFACDRVVDDMCEITTPFFGTTTITAGILFFGIGNSSF